MSVGSMGVSLFATNEGYLDDVEVNTVVDFMLTFFASKSLTTNTIEIIVPIYALATIRARIILAIINTNFTHVS